MTVHSRVTGDVDTLALHCSGASGCQWRRLQEHGAGAIRVIAPDLYGAAGVGHWLGQHAFGLADEAQRILSLPELREKPAASRRALLRGRRGAEALFEEDTAAAAYRAFRFPVLVMRGEFAPAPTLVVAEGLADLIPGAVSAIMAGAGHMGPLTHSEAVNARILAHIGQAAGTRELEAA